MRIRTSVALIVLLVPVAVSAQRLPIPGSRRPGPARPVPLSPQPQSIEYLLAYRRSHVSFESYPMISWFQAPGYGVGSGNWASFGTGTRMDYRLTPIVSATLDVTSSYLGGPAVTSTAEVGTRIRSERTDRTLYPFMDLRIGYVNSYERKGAAYFDGDFGATPLPQGEGSRYSSGFGAMAAVGLEYALGRRWSLISTGGVMRSNMTQHALQSGETRDRRYGLTAYRYTLGLRYNPVRVVRPPGPGGR